MLTLIFLQVLFSISGNPIEHQLKEVDKAGFSITVVPEEAVLSGRKGKICILPFSELGNVAEDQEDMKKFQQVQTILKDGINALSPNRRTGNIFKLKMQEEELSSGFYGKEALENAVLSIE